MNHTIMNQEILQEPERLAVCMKSNLEQIQECARVLREKKPGTVVVAARGTSCNAGKYGKYLIETLLGIPVSIAAPSVLTCYEGKLCLNNALVIGISQSGAAEDVCSLIDRGNADGAMTVAITNTEGSLLAGRANYHFHCCADEEKALAATKTFVTQMEILTLLAAAWAEDEALTEAVSRLPRIIQGVLARQEQIRELVRPWRFITECFILARGLSYPVALECEIKLQETSRIHSQAFSVTNFTHGPVAMVSERAPVLVLACDRKTDENTVSMIKRVQGEGAETLLITNKPEIAKLAPGSALLLDEECEGVKGAFAAATAIQILACELSVLRGGDPDAPRGLTKITVTR